MKLYRHKDTGSIHAAEDAGSHYDQVRIDGDTVSVVEPEKTVTITRKQFEDVYIKSCQFEFPLLGGRFDFICKELGL